MGHPAQQDFKNLGPADGIGNADLDLAEIIDRKSRGRRQRNCREKKNDKQRRAKEGSQRVGGVSRSFNAFDKYLIYPWNISGGGRDARKARQWQPRCILGNVRPYRGGLHKLIGWYENIISRALPTAWSVLDQRTCNMQG